MPVYSVEGKLGTGKTKFTVWVAQQALKNGRRVASNVDLDLSKLVPKISASYVRIPDKPKAADLESCGHGNPESYDEDQNGVMILDELGTWLNARSFQDKDRAPLLDWLIHARKHGWDVYLIVQDANMIDKQVRESLIEYQIKCFRGDKIKIPFVGGFLQDLGQCFSPKSKLGYLPKFHMAVSRVGQGANAVIAERWMYRGLDLHDAYDTRQIFRADYEHGPYSQWHRPPLPSPSLFQRLRSWLKPAPRPRPQYKPMRPEIAALLHLPPDERIRQARAVLTPSHC